MDCKETQKYIMSFLRDELEDSVTDSFMEHVSNCKDCMEELTIQYLVEEGLQRLETGSAFDAQKELEEKIQQAIARRKLHKRMKIGLFLTGMIIAISAVIMISVFLF